MFIPHTESEREEMLATIGVDSMEALFSAVPEKFRFPDLNLPDRLSEMETAGYMTQLAAKNKPISQLTSFLGAGAYNHYSPPAVDAMIQRGEFMTAYTPYQPEISQGTLQAIFEYQSLIVNLTGMDASNASHYDGATAVAEAVNMAYAQFRGKRSKVILSPGLNPQYRATVRTYTNGSGIDVVGEGLSKDLSKGPEALIELIDQDTALVVVQYPDFFGRIYDYTALAEAAHAQKTLLAIAVNPMALGMLKTPGEMGADIVTGDGQPLGIPLSFGGPYLGIFATRQKYVRKMAGRIVGETVDSRGQRGYVLTLATREQHIRREKATSNICTNQGLIALASTVYMSLLGKAGFKQVSELCYHKAQYAAKQIDKVEGYSLAYKAPFYNEFVVECPISAAEVNKQMLEKGFIGGYDLGQESPEYANYLLVAVTEMNTRKQIDDFVVGLTEVQHD